MPDSIKDYRRHRNEPFDACLNCGRAIWLDFEGRACTGCKKSICRWCACYFNPSGDLLLPYCCDCFDEVCDQKERDALEEDKDGQEDPKQEDTEKEP